VSGGVTGVVGRKITWQLVFALLYKDEWEFRHSAEVLDGYDRNMMVQLFKTSEFYLDKVKEPQTRAFCLSTDI
jgi:hypothetical protein